MYVEALQIRNGMATAELNLKYSRDIEKQRGVWWHHQGKFVKYSKKHTVILDCALRERQQCTKKTMTDEAGEAKVIKKLEVQE